MLSDWRAWIQSQFMLVFSARRAAIVAWLIDSLETEEDPDSQTAWDQEVLLRVQQLDSGDVKPIPWSEARRMILGQPDERNPG